MAPGKSPTNREHVVGRAHPRPVHVNALAACWVMEDFMTVLNVAVIGGGNIGASLVTDHVCVQPEIIQFSVV